MIDGHSGHSTNELEVVQVLLVADARVGIDLQRVVVRSRVFEETVVGVEHLLGEQVEPLSGQSAVVQSDLVVELDPQLRLQDVHLVRRKLDLPVRVLQDVLPADLDLELVGHARGLLQLTLQVVVLPFVVPVVGNGWSCDARVGDARIFPLRDPGVVVDEEDPAVGVDPLLPTVWQRSQVVLVRSVGHVGLTGKG